MSKTQTNHTAFLSFYTSEVSKVKKSTPRPTKHSIWRKKSRGQTKIVSVFIVSNFKICLEREHVSKLKVEPLGEYLTTTKVSVAQMREAYHRWWRGGYGSQSRSGRMWKCRRSNIRRARCRCHRCPPRSVAAKQAPSECGWHFDKQRRLAITLARLAMYIACARKVVELDS